MKILITLTFCILTMIAHGQTYKIPDDFPIGYLPVMGNVKEVLSTDSVRFFAKDSGTSENHLTWMASSRLQYNRSGRLIKKISYDKWGNKWMNYFMSYDSKGNRISEEIRNIENKIVDKYLFFYDSLCNKTEQLNFNGMGENMSKVLYEYDKSEHIMQRLIYKSDTLLNDKTVYFFNAKNQCVREVIVSGYKQVSSLPMISAHALEIWYSYDDHGNQKEVATYMNDSLLWHDIRRTSEKQDTIWFTRYDAHGFSDTTHMNMDVYIHDFSGNIIELQKINNGHIVYLITRKIIYYPSSRKKKNLKNPASDTP